MHASATLEESRPQPGEQHVVLVMVPQPGVAHSGVQQHGRKDFSVIVREQVRIPRRGGDGVENCLHGGLPQVIERLTGHGVRLARGDTGGGDHDGGGRGGGSAGMVGGDGHIGLAGCTLRQPLSSEKLHAGGLLGGSRGSGASGEGGGGGVVISGLGGSLLGGGLLGGSLLGGSLLGGSLLGGNLLGGNLLGDGRVGLLLGGSILSGSLVDDRRLGGSLRCGSDSLSGDGPSRASVVTADGVCDDTFSASLSRQSDWHLRLMRWLQS